MQAPDPVPDPEAGVPAAAETLSAQTITMAGEAMIALVHHGTATPDGKDVAALTADPLDRTLRAAGARPLRSDLDFSGLPATGWRAVLTAGDCLTITAPDGSTLYTGTLPARSEWRARARRTQRHRGGLVVIGGIHGTIDDLVPAIVEDRACWIRCPATVPDRPKARSR